MKKTLKDLEKISAVFIRLLCGIYHSRTSYPEGTSIEDNHKKPSKEGFFKLNPVTKNFIKDTLLSKAFKKDQYTSGKLTADKSKFFDKRKFSIRAGNEKLQQQIETGVSEEEIRKSWQEGLKNFKKMRAQYLIYR